MSRSPADERRPDDLLGMRDLFQEEARTILDRLRLRLPELEGQLPDVRGLADVVADGVALKGSGALVGLPVVSRAGVLVVRAAELAAERASDDLAGATSILESLRVGLGALERLLDACLERDDVAQDALLGEALGQFAPGDRALLRGVLDDEDAVRVPEAGGPEAARLPSDATETLQGLVATLTDLLIAETRLGGIEREIETLAAATGEPAAILGQVKDALAARAAPARALARAAGELHRQLRDRVATAPVESLVLLHAGQSCHALAADDVESVVPAAGALRPDGAGQPTLSLDGDVLPALDLAASLGDGGSATPTLAAIVRTGGTRFALLVTRAEVPRPMVLRPLDGLLATHPLSRAATVGPGGNVVFVLRAEALLALLQGRFEPPNESAHPQTRA